MVFIPLFFLSFCIFALSLFISVAIRDIKSITANFLPLRFFRELPNFRAYLLFPMIGVCFVAL